MNDKSELRELLQKIESIKIKLYKLIPKKDLLDPEVIELSQLLDKFLTKYYEIMKNSKENPPPEGGHPEKD